MCVFYVSFLLPATLAANKTFAAQDEPKTQHTATETLWQKLSTHNARRVSASECCLVVFNASPGKYLLAYVGSVAWYKTTARRRAACNNRKGSKCSRCGWIMLPLTSPLGWVGVFNIMPTNREFLEHKFHSYGKLIANSGFAFLWLLCKGKEGFFVLFDSLSMKKQNENCFKTQLNRANAIPVRSTYALPIYHNMPTGHTKCDDKAACFDPIFHRAHTPKA